MTAGAEVAAGATSQTIRRLALVQLSIGALLALAYAVLVGPTLVDVWTEDSADIAFGQMFFTTTALVAVAVVGLTLFTGWELWKSAVDDRHVPTARVLLILQAVSWGAVALVVAVNLFGSFAARPGALMVATSIAVFSIVAGWLVSHERD